MKKSRKFYFLSEIRKMSKNKNGYKIWHEFLKMQKSSGCYFWSNLVLKLIFESQIEFFKAISAFKTFKICVLTTWRWHNGSIQNCGDLFCIFPEPGRTIWGYQSIDLDPSCSYLFFWLHCDHFSAPNDQFLFCHFFIFPIKSSPILTRRRKKIQM